MSVLQMAIGTTCALDNTFLFWAKNYVLELCYSVIIQLLANLDCQLSCSSHILKVEMGFGSASCNASNWRASFSGYSGSV